MRLLAGVPSVVYGLVGILALAPWINEHLISDARKQSVAYVVQLNGADLMIATLILAVMITADHGRDDRQRAGLGADVLAGGLGGARRQPLAHDLARVAAHRAPGDRGRRPCSRPRARWARRSCSRWSRAGAPFAANPLDGITFLFEPVQPLAATIVQEFGGQSIGPMSPHDLRDRRRAARLRGAAVVRRLGRQAAAQALRDRRVMASVAVGGAARTHRRSCAPAAREHRIVAADRPPLLRAVLGGRASACA